MHPDLEQQVLVRRLRELAHAATQPYSWQEFQRRARPRPAQRLAGARSISAVTVLMLGAVAMFTRLGGWSPPRAPLRSMDAQPSLAQRQPAVSNVAVERWLARLPSEPAVVRVGTRAAVIGLEDRIAQVDDLLSTERLEEGPPARLLALQQERRRLVGTLVQVRYAETLAEWSR